MRGIVLTISDSAFRGEREDSSGPAVRKRLEGCGWSISAVEVLPDEPAEISERIRALAADGWDAILTTGGTGVAPRDRTPEATRAVIEREIPGLAERMRAEGMKATPFAALSRGVCGALGETLVVNLPGSPKGALESLDAILELMPHVVRLLHGETGHEK